MNRKKNLNCIAIMVFLSVSVVFFTVSSTNVSAQKSNLMLELGPGQTLGVGIDLGQMVLTVGGSFALRKLSDTTFDLPPTIGIKLFMRRAKLSSYMRGSISNTFVLRRQELHDSIGLSGALGVEYFMEDYLSIGGEVVLILYHRSSSSYTSISSARALTLNYYF